MVFALTAAMLVGTPLTASAAPLNSVYQVTDRWGATTNKKDDNDTRTGTVTATQTNSGVLEASNGITGISLDETNIQMEMGAYDPANLVTEELAVSIDWTENDPEKIDAKLKAALEKSFKWRTADKDIVALQASGGDLTKMKLVAKAGGKTTVTVSLDSDEYDIHYSATANVTVEQYADTLSFVGLDDAAYEGAALKLDDYLVKDPVSATDKVTYVIKDQQEKNSATLKNGTLTLKSGTKYRNKTVTIVAVGKKVTEEKTITIKTATPATSVVITKDGVDVKKNGKLDWLINKDGMELELGVKLTPEEGCTDKVTWSSKKPAVVAIEYKDAKDGSKGVVLKAKGVGSSVIEAKAGKKSAKVTVTVRASLTGINITTENGELYAGQTIQLEADQKFAENGEENFTDAGLNWVFDGTNKEVSAMKKVASLNAKTGLLTIKPDLSVKGAPESKKIVIKAQNAKKIGKNGEAEYMGAKKLDSVNKVEFELKQINVKKITVYGNMSSTAKPIALAELDRNGKPKTIKQGKGEVDIAIDTSRTYKVVVEAEDEQGNDMSDVAANLVSWSSNNVKLATASVNENGSGTVNAIKKGKPTITISSATKQVTKKGKNETVKYVPIKATFKANVTVPTKNITLSVKNTGIAWKNGNQNIKITAKLDKGTTSKTSAIKWSVVPTSSNTTNPEISKGTLKLKKGEYNPGDSFVVTAMLPGTGVQTRITLTVVDPSKKLQFVETTDSDEKYSKKTLYLDDMEEYSLVTKVQKANREPWVVTGTSTAAEVTYTIKKGDCIQLVDGTVKAIKTGKATITAKTSDGKTANLTVEVKAGSAPEQTN